MTSHPPARPGWICGGCDEPWPCRLVRKELAEAYGDDHDALGARLVWLMRAAADDLGERGPVVLYHRFVAWTLPLGHKCRVCHKPRHDVLPGLPPRLFPCGKIHEVL